MIKRVFKVYEVEGYTLEEALSQVNATIIKNVTQSYNKYIKQFGNTPDTELEFMTKKLALTTKYKTNFGYYIVLRNPKIYPKERKFYFENVNNQPNGEFRGRTPFKNIIQLINPDTGEILKEIHGTKDDNLKSERCSVSKKKAKKIIEEIYKAGYQGDIICKRVMVPRFTNRDIMLISRFKDSVNNVKGKYKVFVYINSDRLQ